MNFKNKTALITGAAIGIGRAVAYKLLENGASVVLMDMNEEKLNDLKAELYSELLNVNFKWVSTKEHLKATNNFNYYALIYDRLFDRNIDNSKILKATGLESSDFLPIREGLKIELELLNNSDKE